MAQLLEALGDWIWGVSMWIDAKTLPFSSSGISRGVTVIGHGVGSAIRRLAIHYSLWSHYGYISVLGIVLHTLSRRDWYVSFFTAKDIP